MGIRVFRTFRSWLLIGLVAGVSGHLPAFGNSSSRFIEATSKVHYPRDRSVDFLHLVLDLSFDWERKWVGGDVTFTLTPLATAVRKVTLDSADLRISTIRSGNSPLKFRISGEKLFVDLGREVSPGEEVTFTVSYEANPRKGLYFSGEKGDPDRPPHIWSQGESEDSHYWFPCYDYPNDRVTFESIFTVSDRMTAVGNGSLQETTVDSARGTRTFHYSQKVPAVTYLISVAIGEFDVVRDEYEGIPIEYFVPPGTSRETVLRSFGLTPDMMKFFSERIGVPYPYEKYAQTTVSDFIFGGMENISATTLTLETLHPERVELESSSQGLVAHELAHQWWGDLLTCRDWSHAWLNEGFATYFEALYREYHSGADDFQYRLFRNARDYFKEDREKYRRSIVENVYTDPMDVFDRHLYPKGGWTLHMLRGVVGEDLFWKTIRTYARENFAGVVTTEDLRDAFEKVTGRGLVWFFDQWYHHGGHPEFRVRQEWDEAQGAVRLEVEQVQEVDQVTPLFRMPVRLEFSGESWSREFRIEVSREREEFTFQLPDPPLMTRFDAGQFLLKKLEFERSLTELIYQMKHDSDAAGRIWAAEQMGQRAGQGQSAQGLLEVLRSEPFWGVRIEIAKALGKLHLPVSFDTLLETAGGDPDSRVRAAALAALGKYHGDAAGAGAIRASFQSETNEYVRAAAVKAYAESGAEDAAAFLKKAVPISSHREVIATAAYEGMAKLKDRRFIPTLRKGAAEGNGRRRREAAIRALGKMAGGEDQEEIVDLLIDLLGDRSVFAREAAIKALGTAGSSKAVPLLQAAALNEYDSRLRRAARASVEKIRDSGGSDQGLAKLQERIDNLEAETRQLREELERDSGEIAKVRD